MTTLRIPLVLLALSAPLRAQHLLCVEQNFHSAQLVSRYDGEVLDPVLLNLNLSTGTPPDSPLQAMDVAGETWITDRDAGVVFRFDEDGTYLGDLGNGTERFGGMALFGSRVWIATSGPPYGPALLEFDLGGGLVAVHDVSAQTPEPTSVAVHQGTLLVGDAVGHDIDRYDLDGQFVSTFHDSDGLIGIDRPEQIRVRSNTRVLVAGSGNLSGVYEYNAQGKQTGYYDTAAQGYPDVTGVHDLLDGNFAFTTADGLHVFDTQQGLTTTVYRGFVMGYLTMRAPYDSGRVITQILDASGDGQGNTFNSGLSLAVDGQGNVFAGSLWDDNVLRVDPSGQVTHMWQGDTPFGLGTDAAGNLYVGAGDSVFRVAPDGTTTEILDQTGDGQHDVSGVLEIAVDPDGTVFATSHYNNRVFRVDPAGSVVSVLDGSGDGAGHPLQGPYGIVLDQVTGDVYVTGNDSNNAFRITPAGSITQIVDASGAGPGSDLDSPIGIAFDPSDGDVFVVGFHSRNVLRITPAGAVSEVLDELGDRAGHPLLYCQSGITVGPDGTLYVAGGDLDTGALFEVLPNGTIHHLMGTEGDGHGHLFLKPSDLAYTPNGALIAAGFISDNVLELSAPAELGTHYCGPAVPNSTGKPGAICAAGSPFASDNELRLEASDLPVQQPGYFLTSQAQGFVSGPGGSQGNLCLGSPLGRFADQLNSSGAEGRFAIHVDLTDMPPGHLAVLPGQTWNFQAWYRDKNPTPTSNFTDGVTVTYQ